MTPTEIGLGIVTLISAAMTAHQYWKAREQQVSHEAEQAILATRVADSSRQVIALVFSIRKLAEWLDDEQKEADRYAVYRTLRTIHIQAETIQWTLVDETKRLEDATGRAFLPSPRVRSEHTAPRVEAEDDGADEP